MWGPPLRAIWPLTLLLVLLIRVSSSKMVMDESSCHEVEEEECGLCHTVYMEECSMKEVEEMRPMKKRMCRPRQECKMEMVVEEVEESRPVCSVKAMDSQHKPCRMSDENNINGCRRMVDCKIKKKMMKKPKEKKVCVKGKGEECFNVVKLEKQMQEKKSCSFHPKTVCHPSRMKECRRVKKKMCNYLDSNRL